MSKVKEGDMDFKLKGYHSKSEMRRLEAGKRKVKKKKITAWANVYPERSPHLYDTKRIADRLADNDRIACVELTGEYEVEE
jgi:hypothetical protein